MSASAAPASRIGISAEAVDKSGSQASLDSIRGSKSSLHRKKSDRYQHEKSGSFQTKKELEEEISKLKNLVQELTDKNTEMNQYLETLLCKVMEHCPEVLHK